KLEKIILNLPKTLLARYIRLTDVMQEFGPNIGFPHTKHLANGLYELRLKGAEGIARVFFCTIIQRKITMLHCFIKKQKKIPKKELEIVKYRLKEIYNESL
ncbi:MAG: type II toxin-antitoxin system RelE/ParE family toxin, partial [Pseudomonadota bacterium]